MVYICKSQSPNSSHHHPSPCHFPRLGSIHLSSASVSLFLPCKPVHLYHFSRFHIYALIYNICFSLYDLLHSVWRSLDPSTSLQMTQFRSFLWLSNIPLYICTTTALFVCFWTGRSTLFIFNSFYIVLQLINKVVLVSGVQQNDSGLHIQESMLFQILFSIRLLQNIDQSYLWCFFLFYWYEILH